MTRQFSRVEEGQITSIETACTNSVVRALQKDYCEIEEEKE